MRRARLAPVLSSLLKGYDVGGKEARRELRALLSVARAAQRFMNMDGRGDRYGIPKALDRLAAASRGREGEDRPKPGCSWTCATYRGKPCDCRVSPRGSTVERSAKLDANSEGEDR